jgi:AraC-like DNA-binding protein
MQTGNSENWIYQAKGEIDRIEACFSGTAFAPHRHDTYAIGITLHGVQSFDYRGQTRNALPGDLVILHPDETHDGRAGSDATFRYRTLYLEPAVLQEALQGRPLPFLKGGISSETKLAKAVWQMLEDLERPLGELERQDAIYDLAIALEGAAGQSRQRSPSNYRAAEEARQIILARLEDGVTLPELEAAIDHDRWELSRDFRSLFGTSPYRYLTLRRLDQARAMLQAGQPIADTAVACAFSDQSHFTRQFKKAYGVTPKSWMKSQRTIN